MQLVSDLFSGLSLKAAVAVVAGGLMGLFDMAHPSVRPLAYLMLFDFALGAAHAWKCGLFGWPGIKRGIGKFAVYAMALGITSVADSGLDTEILGVSPLTWSFCVYLITCEALSCLRHLTVLGGPKLPPWLFSRLEYLQKSMETPQRRREDWQLPPEPPAPEAAPEAAPEPKAKKKGAGQ